MIRITNPYLLLFYILIFIILYPSVVFGQSGGSITNKIAKALKNTGYQEKPMTLRQAKQDHDGNWLNCIQFCIRIKEIDPNAKIYEVGGKHAIVELTDEKGKLITYSNGKIVKNSSYVKIKRLD